MGRSARATLGHQFAKTLSGRSADNLNPEPENPKPRTNRPANQPEEENLTTTPQQGYRI